MYCFHISYLSIMQKFRQHNKIFVQACNWEQNAVKYSLTKNRQTAVRGRPSGSFLRRPAGYCRVIKGKQNYDLSH